MVLSGGFFLDVSCVTIYSVTTDIGVLVVRLAVVLGLKVLVENPQVVTHVRDDCRELVLTD